MFRSSGRLNRPVRGLRLSSVAMRSWCESPVCRAASRCASHSLDVRGEHGGAPSRSERVMGGAED